MLGAVKYLRGPNLLFKKYSGLKLRWPRTKLRSNERRLGETHEVGSMGRDRRDEIEERREERGEGREERGEKREEREKRREKRGERREKREEKREKRAERREKSAERREEIEERRHERRGKQSEKQSESNRRAKREQSESRASTFRAHFLPCFVLGSSFCKYFVARSAGMGPGAPF